MHSEQYRWIARETELENSPPRRKSLTVDQIDWLSCTVIEYISSQSVNLILWIVNDLTIGHDFENKMREREMKKNTLVNISRPCQMNIVFFCLVSFRLLLFLFWTA